jgi:signal transduction histidine kinase
VKTPGLRLKILLMLLVPLVIFAPITVAIVYGAVQTAITEQVDARGRVLAQQVAAVVLDEILTGEHHAAERAMIDIVSAQPDVAYAFVVDARSAVLAHTFPAAFPSDLAKAHDLLRDDRRAILVALGDSEVHDLMAPMLGGVAGWVHVGVSTAPARASSRAVLWRLSLAAAGVVFSGLVLTLLISAQLSWRIERVANAAESLGQGELDTRIADSSDDELGRLGSAFDRMAERLLHARAERERTFQRLAQSEKLVAVGQLAAGVAHEVNNPLAGVLHCIDGLRKNDRDEARRGKYYELIADGVRRAQGVVKNLLQYARQHELEIACVDLGCVVDRVLALMTPAFESSSVALELSRDSEAIAARVDAHGIEQVLTNILLNAKDALPDGGGKVEVDLRRVDGCARIRITDQGCGIPQASLDRVFDPFFTTKGGSKGSGLGLSVSLGIVERHGGRIEASSVVGAGTTFDVYLPLAGSVEEQVA